MSFHIRELKLEESIPMNLLLLADPSEENINDYVKRGNCFIAEFKKEIVGVYVLLPTRPNTVELINVAVSTEYQGKGIGKQLVTNAIQVARERDYKMIEVGTGNSSINQLALYQK